MRSEDEIENKIEELLNNFYRRRIDKLNGLGLMATLKKKNPYLFKAIGTEKASEIVENMLLAFMSSSDEGIFGDAFFEPLAVFVSTGDPAPSSGVDIVLQDEKKYTAIAVKSGTSVFNSQSKKKQETDFNALRNRMFKLQKVFDPVIGYAYGRKNQRENTSSAIRELAGQAFWHEITGDPDFYLKIIKLMKDLPLKHAIEYKEAWDHAVNRFTRDFAEQFCDKDGAIVWEKIVEYNSSSTSPTKGKRKKKKENGVIWRISSLEVMRELGPGFLERVYKNAVFIAMRQKGLQVDVEHPYEVVFRGKVIGRYHADLVVGQTVIVELKCCDSLIREHQAQLFNYLKAARLPVGLLVNFRRRKLEWKRLQSNEECFDKEEVEETILF